MLAANTPMQVAIEASDGDHSRRSSLDMELHNTDSCGSWCDMDDGDGLQQGAGAGEDSPHYSAMLHGTPMAISLAANSSPSSRLQ